MVDRLLVHIAGLVSDEGAGRQRHRIAADAEGHKFFGGIDAATGAQLEAAAEIKDADVRVNREAPAEVREGYACGEAELADERILAAAESGLKRPRRGRKIAGSRDAGEVGIARQVQRYSKAYIEVAAAEVGGIHRCRAAAA